MQESYYLYQYLIGTAIANYVAYKILNNQDDMKEKYLKLLTLGNSVSINDALKVIDIDLNKEDYVDNVINVLVPKIKQMNNLMN